MEDLQKQVDSLQAELASVKKQLAASSTPAPTSATNATPAAAAAPVVAPAGAEASAAPATGQTPTPAASGLASLLGPLNITGFVDGYYSYNFEHPQENSPSVLPGNPNTGLSGLRAFDSPYSQLSLNAIELIMDKPPDANNSRIGYHLAFGFGNAFNVINSASPGDSGFAQYLKEAYGSYLAPVGKGLQIDFGKFVTPAGAEVIESKDNWNYSRGLLYSYAIPFYHFGFRAKYAFNDKYSLTGFLVNGWNNIVGINTGKTYGLSFGWNPNKKVSISENYLAGPQESHDTRNWRQLADTILTYSPTSKLSFTLNYDYGRGDRTPAVTSPVWWTGGAGYIRYQFNDRYALSTRYEYYNDHFGFTTGTAQHINEVTETFERKVGGSFITRLEYRRDMASQPSLFKGKTPVDYQDTLAAGLIYTFDMKELK
jgi:hypothetical protein